MATPMAAPPIEWKGVVGIQNMGNTCYCKSTLQLIRACPEWSAYCISHLTKEQLSLVLQRQCELEQKLDIIYTSYALKISIKQFWQANLWDYLNIHPEAVEIGLEGI